MASQNTPTLIVIAGPTASGKTAAAIALARHFNTAIISADSRQFFREMSIGTAKPTDEELAAAPHYFINSHAIIEPFSVGDFERQGMQLINDLFKVHNTVILAGGSGLYIKAITDGFDELPSADPAIREKLNKELSENGLAALQEQLKNVDPTYYDEVDIHNPQRVTRALEVFLSTGKPFSSYRTASAVKRPFQTIKFALDWDRETLYNRINQRVDLMIEQGLVDEVKSLLPYRHLNALATVGYSEIFNYLDGNTDLPTAIAAIKQNTRRFAKRQLTWFRREGNMIWMDASKPDMVEAMIAITEQERQK
ncbi:tRNA (adenosine(37)-N6)-dimethylallyltransferase MiaA [Mucilaginibacter pallidiroseus]|uniref:tRNA dimethylallyltransferase n=2 Tax=Mucilaginibacter pallidiroseus TaxID=2599295 RepID=A0A563UD34_9SPHI|nr:tRNA (adenosine(37)-N6)-dimethylallyltransferase MiaA [Mucilaginibacter pallidiroseus]